MQIYTPLLRMAVVCFFGLRLRKAESDKMKYSYETFISLDEIML